jgi:acetylornithine/succinyldiaminopimelate/putrescine aminotransferase
VITFAPSLHITKQEIDLGLELLAQALHRVVGKH